MSARWVFPLFTPLAPIVRKTVNCLLPSEAHSSSGSSGGSAGSAGHRSQDCGAPGPPMETHQPLTTALTVHHLGYPA